MTTPDDQSNDYRPTGFCPYCDYAIDPGVCPECGESVTSAKLRRRSRSVTWRRRRRGIVVAVLLVGAFFGGRWVYHNVDWMSHFPTWVLLSAQGDETSAATTELLRRFAAGELSDAEAQRMLEQAVPKRTVLRVVSPQPAGQPIRVVVYPGLLLPPVVSTGMPYCHVDDMLLILDGRKGSPIDIGLDGNWGERGPLVGGWLPRLTAGTHDVALRGNIELRLHGGLLGQLTVWPKVMVADRTHLEVVDKPIDEFVRWNWSPDLASEISKSITLELTANRVGVHALLIRYKSLPVVIAATIHVESTHCEGKRWTGGFRTRSTAGRSTVCQFAFWCPDAIKDDGLIVRLVPDTESCFDTGSDVCFGGIIEWADDPSREGKHAWMKTFAEQPVPPTSIVPAEGLRLVPPRSDD